MVEFGPPGLARIGEGGRSHEGWGPVASRSLQRRRVPGQRGDPGQAVGEGAVPASLGMLGGGWVSRPPARGDRAARL